MVNGNNNIASQLTTARKQIESSRATLLQRQSQVNRSIEQAKKIPQAVLRNQTLNQARKNQAIIRKELKNLDLEQKSISQQQQKLKSFESQVSTAEKAVGVSLQDVQDRELARKVLAQVKAGKGQAIFALTTPRQQELFRFFKDQEKSFKAREKAIKELGGGKFEKGIEKLTSIKLLEKEFGKLEKVNLEKLTPPQIAKFERAGLVQRVAPSVPGIPTSQLRQVQPGEVQPALQKTILSKLRNLSANIIEATTKKKPREVFREVVGSPEKDVTKKLTAKEVIFEATQIPKRIIKIAAPFGGKGAETVLKKVIPEGVPVKLKGAPKKTITVLEPQFGTVTDEALRGIIKKTIIIPKKEEKIVRIFEPKRVGEAVEVGIELGTFAAAPTVFAPGLVTSGTKTALDPEKTTKEKLLGAAEAGFGTFILSAAATKFLRTPIIKKFPLRDIETPKATIVSKVVDVEGEPKLASVFEIRGEVTPPVKVIETTKGAEILKKVVKPLEKIVQVGKKPVVSLKIPEKITEIPAKRFSVKTVVPVIGDETFIVSEAIAGRKFLTLSKIKGKTIPRNLEDFNKLSNIEKNLFQELAEEIIGRPVQLRLVPKVLSSQRKKVATLIKSKKVLRVTPKKFGADFKPAVQKKGELTLGVTELRKKASTEIAEVTLAKTITRPIASKLPQVGVKTQKIDKTFILLKDPKATVGAKVISPAKIKKTPLSKTFQEQVQEVQLVAATVPLPKTQPIKPSKVTLKPSKATQDLVPGIIGEVGLKVESKFAGTGEFEKSESVSSLNLKTKLLEKQNILVDQVSSPQLKQKLVQQVKQVPQLKQLSKQQQKFKQAQQLKQQLNLKQQLKQQQSSASSTAALVKLKLKPLIPKVPFPPFPRGAVNQKLGLKKGGKLGFVPEVKQGKKWIKVSGPKRNLQSAKNLQRFVVDNSTSQRGRVRQVRDVKEFSKRTAPPTQANKFRNFKIVKGRKVRLKQNLEIEKRKFAIDTRGEVQGLKAAKVIANRFGRKIRKIGKKPTLRSPSKFKFR